MDAFSDPEIEEVYVMSSAQVGKTSIMENVAAYFIDYDPSPQLIVQPTLVVVDAFSQDRLGPMLNDTPALRGKVKDPKAKRSDNTKRHKVYSGGHVTLCGANSPASLMSRPIRVVQCDEVDQYKPTAAGDAIKLAYKRATTFWNRKLALYSTPTDRGFSRIEAAYLSSDMRKFHVPCTRCGEYQVLKWSRDRVKWPRDKGRHIPALAYYVCEFCEAHLADIDLLQMVRMGFWKASRKTNGIAGFWINELYSPWVTLGRMAANFLDAKNAGPEELKVFVNSSLAETWEVGDTITIDDGSLMARRERYGEKVNEDCVIITAGVDVQTDRIEVEVVAWAPGEESYGLEYVTLHGDPGKNEVWDDLDDFLLKEYEHESGIKLRIASVGLDTGHHTEQAYKFIGPRQVRGVHAVKGASLPGQPLVSAPRKSSVTKVKLYMIGTDTAKDILFSRLHIETFGAGYMHFPASYDEEYFLQLTAEKAVTVYKKGIPVKEYRKIRARNEALDARVYSMAALNLFLTYKNTTLEKIAEALKEYKVSPTAPAKRGRRVFSKGVSNE